MSRWRLKLQHYTPGALASLLSLEWFCCVRAGCCAATHARRTHTQSVRRARGCGGQRSGARRVRAGGENSKCQHDSEHCTGQCARSCGSSRTAGEWILPDAASSRDASAAPRSLMAWPCSAVCSQGSAAGCSCVRCIVLCRALQTELLTCRALAALHCSSRVLTDRTDTWPRNSGIVLPKAWHGEYICQSTSTRRSESSRGLLHTHDVARSSVCG